MRKVEFSQLRKRPYATRHIALVPLVYLRQPDYWEIEVVGCLRGLGLPVLTPAACATHQRAGEPLPSREQEESDASKSRVLDDRCPDPRSTLPEPLRRPSSVRRCAPAVPTV